MYYKNVLYNMFFYYFCRVFFIVLELRLRLMKIGCREAINFFYLISPQKLSSEFKNFFKRCLTRLALCSYTKNFVYFCSL